MISVLEAGALAGAVTAVSGVALMVIAVARRVIPAVSRLVRNMDSLFEVLLGRDEEAANPITGGPGHAAVPGIGVRMARLEEAVTVLADQRVTLDDHERRLGALEEGCRHAA